MDLLTDAKRSAARVLEGGRLSGAVFEAAARIWAERSRRTLARPLSWPDGVFTVGVGGATLGGSYKTPTTIAVADRLARAGLRVALIGHAYRARPERARTVEASDDVRVVGDEALVCARALGRRARVLVAPARQQAIDLAVLLGAEALVFDGVLQARPRRFGCAAGSPRRSRSAGPRSP